MTDQHQKDQHRQRQVWFDLQALVDLDLKEKGYE